ncbi:MAG: hypothetical protein HYY05_02095 [Chloroflexi bacterium]|nr:hypothetical protein [Chloroflexota bacterium]
MRPHYRLARPFIATMLVALASGQRRDLARDARRILRHSSVPPCIEGPERIPAEGPIIVVANHYERPGLWNVWGTMLISATVAGRRQERAPSWVMADDWPGFRLAGIPFPAALVRWTYRRLARCYGFVQLPLRPAEVAGRARALRAAARLLVSRDAPPSLGYFPEGDVSEALIEARPGSGTALLVLSRREVPLIPVAVHERQGRLTLTVGEPFRLAVPEGLPRELQDEAARRHVMLAIGRMLPPALWGFYAEDLSHYDGPPAHASA